MTDGVAAGPALDPELFRQLGYRAVDLAAAHLAGVRDGPVFQPMTEAERRELLDEALPATGIVPDAILERFRSAVLPHPMGNGHPRFFGWVNSPPAPIGAVADLLAAALNPSCAGGDHAAIYVERAATRWLMDLTGFPTAGSMGLLVSGGSMASLTGIAAARHWAARQDGWNVREEGLQHGRPPFVLYLSAEGHSTMRKAAELLGLGAAGVHTIPVDAGYRMDVDALRAAIAEDRAAGKRPFCVAASAGTVSTGASDRFDLLSDLCRDEGLWLHVDGAYGALGRLDPEVADRFAGMEWADSLALDPHKWLSVPVECGCVLVRDGALLRDAFSLVPPYLRTEEGLGFGGLPWFAEYGFQQSRGFRALKLWMTLLQLGREGVVALIQRQNRLARRLAEMIDATPELERPVPVELSIVCFRYAPPELRGDEARLDALNKAIMEAVQAGGEAFLTQAVLDGRFLLRANVLHYATTESDLAALLDVVRRTGRALLGQA
ncbi:MAG: aminotransferase class V-fold PLP-dependent enzyme [Thermomicrobiales bacterium]|nr:aminotransferase class V-fold PLP-dependent enzyme [Thermomicrobiales bacterium]